MTIGNDIRIKREFLKMSTSELARRCGVTKQTISNYENKNHSKDEPITRIIYQELGKAFIEVDLHELIFGRINLTCRIEEQS